MSNEKRTAWAWGLATVHTNGSVLDAWFPEPQLGGAVTDEAPSMLTEAQYVDEIRQVQTRTVRVEIDLDEATLARLRGICPAAMQICEKQGEPDGKARRQGDGRRCSAALYKR